MHVKTTTVSSYLMMRSLAWLKWIGPSSTRVRGARDGAAAPARDGQPELAPAERAAQIRAARLAALAPPEVPSPSQAIAKPVVWLTETDG